MKFQGASGVREDLCKPHKPVQKGARSYAVSKELGYLPPRLKNRTQPDARPEDEQAQREREKSLKLKVLAPPDTRPEWLKQKAKSAPTGEQADAAKTAKVEEIAGTQVSNEKVYRKFEDAPDVSD